MNTILTTIAAAMVMLLSCTCGYAIHLGANDLPYAQSMDHPLDRPLNEAFSGKCFFMNLGPTGIRARIDPDAPTHFKVQYVFQDSKSPAREKIKKGDVIIGANGKTFRTPHGFHRKKGGRGWVGPPFELALEIEDSQGKNGKLDLMVLPGGDNSKKTTVTLQLEPVGRFADTYPWNCPRSDKLLKELCDFLIDSGVKGRHHYQIQQLLALWAADDARVMPLVKAKVESLIKHPPSYTATGMCTWDWGYSGILLGEYYNQTQDKGVVSAAEALKQCFELGQDWRSGGYSHRPFPAIEQRIAEGGPKGYGSMAGPGGLAMLAQSIFKATGLPYSERAYYRTHQAFLQTAGPDSKASIAYGFAGWPHTLIRLQSALSPSKSGKGIGYLCPTGMENIGDFKVEEWAQVGSEWKMNLVSSQGYSWMRTEADRLAVFESGYYLNDGGQQRMVVRPTEVAEPTQPYRTEPGGGGNVAPMGMGAAAHFIGNKGNESWGYLGKHLANGCALSAAMMFDGHADATMHSFFSVLGAARADEKAFREYLDYAKTWIILSESHDGQGLIDQPFGCQHNATASISRDRTAYTHTAILLLSIPKRKLLITGADYAMPSAKTSSLSTRRPTPTPTRPVLRKPRTMTPDRLAILEKSLLSSLVRLSHDDKLTPVPLRISTSPHNVWLAEAATDGALTFQVMDGAGRSKWTLDDLEDRDQVTLALLISRLKPESTDAMAMVGVYMEALGNVRVADEYYAKAGAESRAKLEVLFQDP